MCRCCHTHLQRLHGGRCETRAAINTKKHQIKEQVAKGKDKLTGITKVLLQHFEGVVTPGMFYSLPRALLNGTELSNSLMTDFGAASSSGGVDNMISEEWRHDTAVAATYNDAAEGGHASQDAEVIFRIVHMRPNSYKRPTSSTNNLSSDSIAIQPYTEHSITGTSQQSTPTMMS